jgi:hypothetical protein
MQGITEEGEESAALLVGQRNRLRRHFSTLDPIIDSGPTLSVFQALGIPRQSTEVMPAARNG